MLPTRQRLRRSSAGMAEDPFTLYVALNEQGNAFGKLFMDDSISFDYQEGGYILKEFSYSKGHFTCREGKREGAAAKENSVFTTHSEVERIVIFGLDKAPKSITVKYETHNPMAGGVEGTIGGSIPLAFTAMSNEVLVIRKPNVRVQADWTMSFEF